MLLFSCHAASVFCVCFTHELNGTLTKAMSCRDCHCFWMVGNWCLCLLFTLREKRVNVFHIFTYITLVHHYLHGGMVVYMLVHGEKLKDQHFTLPTYVTQMGLLLKKFMNAQSSLCTGHGPR